MGGDTDYVARMYDTEATVYSTENGEVSISSCGKTSELLLALRVISNAFLTAYVVVKT